MSTLPHARSFSVKDRRRMAEADLPAHDFSVEDYHRLADIGVLTWGVRDVELLDGQIYDIMPIGPFHSGVNCQLEAIFHRAGGERWQVRSQSPVRLDGGSEPQPDVALVKPRKDFYRKGHPQAEDIFLLVEVAESSVRFDREEKLPVYARAGVQEYWIVNLIDKIVEVYRKPSQLGTYGSSLRLGGEAQVAPEALPDVVIAIADLLGTDLD